MTTSVVDSVEEGSSVGSWVLTGNSLVDGWSVLRGEVASLVETVVPSVCSPVSVDWVVTVPPLSGSVETSGNGEPVIVLVSIPLPVVVSSPPKVKSSEGKEKTSVVFSEITLTYRTRCSMPNLSHKYRYIESRSTLPVQAS